MITYLDEKDDINKSEFILKYQNHLGTDTHENKLFKFHDEAKGLKYFKGYLNQQGFDNLVLPHHDVEHESGRNPDRSVETGGKYFNKVIDDYISNYIPNNRFSDCHNKAFEQKNCFFKLSDKILRADFLFVTNNKSIAHLTDDYNSYYPETSIFIGNGFHRMIAFGLFICENGFRPLEVFYVKC